MSLIRTATARILGRAARVLVPQRKIHHLSLHHASDQEIDKRFEEYFSCSDLDGWDVRQAMNDLCGMDMVPEPRIIISALNACRRVNDYAIAVRFLEAVKDKCGNNVNTIYPYILQEIAPTLCELGIDTPEYLGYDKPQFYLESVYNIH